MTQHIQKMKGFKATSTFPGFENCRILMVDHNNNVIGVPVTQNQLFVKRLMKVGKNYRRKHSRWVPLKILTPVLIEFDSNQTLEDSVKDICRAFNYPYELLFKDAEEKETSAE